MQDNSLATSLVSRWQHVFSGLVAAFLLLPVPAYAVGIFGNEWTLFTGTDWTLADADNNSLVFIQPLTAASPSDTFTIRNTVTSNVGESLTAQITNLQTLSLGSNSNLSIGIVVSGGESGPQVMLDSENINNQFSGPTTLPSTLAVPNSAFLDNGTEYTIDITFTFTGIGNYQSAASSAINIDFNVAP